jgi:hypothetical protein
LYKKYEGLSRIIFENYFGEKNERKDFEKGWAKGDY